MNILILFFLAANVLISYKGFNDSYFFRNYEFQISRIKSGEHIRMLSSGFLHVDYVHLAFNMYALYMFAPYVIMQTNNVIFTFIYMGSLVAGNLLTLYFYKNDYSYRAVGASGAVTGVIYSAILLQPNMSLRFIFLPFFDIPGYVFGIGYLLYSIYGMKSKSDNIGHTAHFGGAIGGYFITLIYRTNLIFENTKMVILLTIPILILMYLDRTNKL